VKPLQIFKAGKHVASDGRVITFTEAQVKATAAAYDPALHEAPLVIGHPKSNDPAFGWAKGLTFSAGSAPLLIAEPHQVNPEFAELVNGGAFKKISASFYEPDSPDNPKPGVYYLRHIGFLGAKPPAVKGLKAAEFSADEKGVVEFMDWSQRDIATIFRSIRDFFIGEFGQEKADKVIPSYMVDSIQEDAVRTTTETAISGVSYQEQETDVQTKEQLEARQRELDNQAAEQKRKEEAKTAEFAEREAKVKASEAAQRRVLIVGEVDALIAAGKILPKDKLGLVAFMEVLPEGGIVEFGEGDKKEKKPSIDWLRGFLKTLPKAVEFKERGNGGVDVEQSADPLVRAAALSRAALEFQESEKKAGRTIDIASAVAHVKAQQSA
jgi:hypothetical protein